MKKIALVLVLLLAMSTVAIFAEDESPVSVYVGGSATTNFIFDLDDNGYALSNYIDADVALTFGSPVARSGEGDVYGEISISNLALTQDYYFGTPTGNNDYYPMVDLPAANATSGDGSYFWAETPVWTAKIVAGDFYVKIDGNEAIRARREVMASVLDEFSLIGLSYKGSYPSFAAAGTMAVGFKVPDVVGVTVKVGTENNTATVANEMGAAIDVSLLAVEDLGVDASFVFATDGTLGLGATVSYGIALDSMTLTPYGGIDFDVEASSYEVGGGLKVNWDSAKGGMYKGSSTKGFLDAKYMIGTGADVAVKFDGTNVDLAVTAAMLPVENLTSIALFEMDDLSTMGMGAYVDYTVPKTVKGYGWFKYTTAADFLVGAEYLGISNTKIGAKYAYATNAITAYCTVSAW